MSTTPTRWSVECDRADLFGCETAPEEVSAPSLKVVREAMRRSGWHVGPWPKWGGAHSYEFCPSCVAYVTRRLKEWVNLTDAEWTE